MIQVLVSQMAAHIEGPQIREHVLYRIRHPDQGSKFAAIVAPILKYDDETILRTLSRAGYDGMVFIGDLVREIVGDVFFEPQNDRLELHLFACEVRRECRFHGIGTRIVEAFLAHAWDHGFRIVRLSAGNDKEQFMLRVLEKAVRGELDLQGFRVEHDGGEGLGWARLIPVTAKATA